MKLREYQQEGVDQLRTSLGSGLKRVVYYGATGSGKTEVIVAMVIGAIRKGKRVAVLANRVHLCRGIAERFDRYGIEYGVLQGGNTRNIHSPVIIGSINTVEKRGLSDVDLIIIDECHAVAGSKMYKDLIFKLNNVPVVGVSATPFSKGMAKTYKELGEQPLFQKLIVTATIRELIEDGHLVDCDVYAPSEPDLTGLKLARNSFGEYDYSDKSEEFAAAVDKPQLVGDIVNHWHRLAEGKPTICFATSIAHSQHIVEQFKSSGVTAEHIDCYMDEDVKEEILSRFKAGEFTVLSNCALLAEGFDYPACEVMILARPTKSLIRFVQMAGRILRPFHGKDRGLLLDHSGSVKHLGFPTDDLPLELDDGTAAAKQSKKEREEPKPKECPKCKFLKAPKVRICPKCGFEPVRQPDEVEHEDGDLVKMDRAKKLAKPSKQDIWSECLGLSEIRGKDKNWASGLYKFITTVWPRGLSDIAVEPSPQMLGYEHSRRIAYAKKMEKEKQKAGESSGMSAEQRLSTLKALIAKRSGNHAERS